MEMKIDQDIHKGQNWTTQNQVTLCAVYLTCSTDNDYLYNTRNK